MFEWLKKNKKNKEPIKFYPEQEYLDSIEESLWEIKEEYDLPTEEIENTVLSKRDNLKYMHKKLKEKK